jgi:hypothetical protein
MRDVSGERTMPAPMVLPMAAAIPSQTPRTRNKQPLDAEALEDASKLVDNMGHGNFRRRAIIVAPPKNATGFRVCTYKP